tara:strand:+ start:236 stop:913 length:678 start_codon:yes stop_codon:yes gene_type:complete
MKSLCFSGCSFTFGDELKDPFNERFSTIVSNHYGCNHFNLSECGYSNDAIVRKTIKYLESNKPDAVCIQFTVPSRLEYFTNRGQIENWSVQHPRSRTNVNRYYISVYNKIMGCENIWKNIFLFDSYCKSKDIKYVSLIADHYEPVLRKPEKHYHIINGFGDHNNMGYWRSLCDGMHPWFLHRDLLGDIREEKYQLNYSHGKNGGHPTAQGHSLIAKLVIELMDAI